MELLWEYIFGLLLTNAKSFGVPFLSPFSPRVHGGESNELYKLPIWNQEKRPEYLNPKDETREPNISRGWAQGKDIIEVAQIARGGFGRVIVAAIIMFLLLYISSIFLISEAIVLPYPTNLESFLPMLQLARITISISF